MLVGDIITGIRSRTRCERFNCLIVRILFWRYLRKVRLKYWMCMFCVVCCKVMLWWRD